MTQVLKKNVCIGNCPFPSPLLSLRRLTVNGQLRRQRQILWNLKLNQLESLIQGKEKSYKKEI